MAQCLGILWKSCSLIWVFKRSDSFGKGRQAIFSRKNVELFNTFFLDKKMVCQKMGATLVKLPNISWVQNILEICGYDSEPSYQSGCNIRHIRWKGWLKKLQRTGWMMICHLKTTPQKWSYEYPNYYSISTLLNVKSYWITIFPSRISFLLNPRKSFEIHDSILK